MKLRNDLRQWVGALGIGMALVWTPIAGADTFRADPVETLRQALLLALPRKIEDRDLKPEDKGKPSEVKQAIIDKLQNEENAPRDRALRESIEPIKSIPDMRRALLLSDWRPNEPDIASNVDAKYRQLLFDRLRAAVQRGLTSGSLTNRLATMNMLAETSTSIKTPAFPRGPGVIFQADLADLVRKDPSPQIRRAAAMTLALSFAEPEVAVPAMEALLGSSSLEDRQSAAEAMESLVRTARALGPTSQGIEKVQASPAAVTAAAAAVTRAIGKGMKDADPAVRRQSGRALLEAAGALADLVPQRAVGTENADSLLSSGLGDVRAMLMPLMQALRKQAGVIAQAMKDPDPEVRNLAEQVLEQIGTSRERLQPPPVPPSGTIRPGSGPEGQTNLSDSGIRVASAGQAPAGAAAGQAPAGANDADPLLETMRSALPALTERVSAPDPRTRLGALDVLETMGPAAAAAEPAIIKATSDRNRYVRWSAARTLGKIGPVDTAHSVPALARLVHDEDLDLNLAAMRALERYGPSAKSAIGDLVRALGATDAQKRKSALLTLQAIGTDARPAIPAIAVALDDEDYRVREAAATLLGHFGPAAAQAEDALRNHLRDPNAEVRKAVSDSLLYILQDSEKK